MNSELDSAVPTYLEVLTLADIASWQVPLEGAASPLQPGLPAIQRGVIWRAPQTEALWDSLCRGFPIGIFLLAPHDQSKGTRRMEGDRRKEQSTNCHLLDGQQRATSIASGFVDPWTMNVEKPPAVLWLDIAPPDDQDDRAYVFRLVTAIHPWGFRRKKNDQRKTERLEAREIRGALKAYADADSSLENCRASSIPLAKVWPWDAIAPLPVPLILKSVCSADPKNDLEERLSELPFWKAETLKSRGSNCWKRSVLDAIRGTDRALAERLDGVLDAFKILAGSHASGAKYLVPAINMAQSSVSPLVDVSGPEQMTHIGHSTSKDPFDTLFYRVNSGGTPLAGEEYVYSMLKAACPAIAEEMSKIPSLTTPARQVIVAAHLAIARADSSASVPPTSVSVRRFRELIRKSETKGTGKESEFTDGLAQFLAGNPSIAGSGPWCFDKAKSLLTSGPWGLPLPLVSNLARGPIGLRVMTILLRWIDRVGNAGIDPLALDECQKRKIVGTLTAWRWLSEESGAGLGIVWGRLQDMAPKDLPSFFNSETFQSAIDREQASDRFAILPPLPPDVLGAAIDELVPGCADDQDADVGERLQQWRDESDWKRRAPAAVRAWMKSRGFGTDESAAVVKYWGSSAGKIVDEYRFVLYSQRSWMKKWFADYDPTVPESIVDVNLPWDYDHLHAASYMRTDSRGHNNIPAILKYWHSSIGNLRAWPLELNRSDQDDDLRKKFSRAHELDSTFGLSGEEVKREASFVSDDVWTSFCASIPVDDFPKNYLAKQEFAGCRIALIRALCRRTVDMYRDWYDTLLIGELMVSDKNP